MRLDMRLDVLLAAEFLETAVEEASPLAVILVLVTDVLLDFLCRDTGVLNAGVDVEVGQNHLARGHGWPQGRVGHVSDVWGVCGGSEELLVTERTSNGGR
jgi:hypothetical protein